MNYLLFITKNGLTKKTPVEEYQNIRSSGLIAIKLDSDDQLLRVLPASNQNEFILVTARGKSIRFSEKNIRPTGRATRGVTGIRMKKDDAVIGAEVITAQKTPNAPSLLTISQNGFGKRTSLDEYKPQKRGGQGIFTAKITSKTGPLVDIALLESDDKKDQKIDLLISSIRGQVIRLPLKDVPILGRQTQGVKLINLKSGDRTAAVTLVRESE